MRGDFEIDTSGYPVGAMPTGVNRGEFYVMDTVMMNKLLDGLVVSKEAAVQVAGYLNNQIRTAGLAKDWTTLNAASLERYHAIKSKVPQIEPVVIEAPDSTPDAQGEQDSGAGHIEGTQDIALASLTAPSSETSAALAAIIAEASGHSDTGGSESAGPVDSAPDTNDADKPAELPADTPADVGAGEAVAGSIPGAIPAIPAVVVPAIAPLKAPAK